MIYLKWIADFIRFMVCVICYGVVSVFDWIGEISNPDKTWSELWKEFKGFFKKGK